MRGKPTQNMPHSGNPALQAAVERLKARPNLRTLSIVSVHAVMAMRLCVLCSHSAQDPSPALRERFQSSLAANHFRLLMTTIDAGWPDNFQVSRPCCVGMTPDEALIASLVHSAANDDRATFTWHSGDLLTEEVRDQIWMRMVSWLGALPNPHFL
jgi:hypothetical protein